MVSTEAKKGGLLAAGIGLTMLALEQGRAGNFPIAILLGVIGLGMVVTSQYFGLSDETLKIILGYLTMKKISKKKEKTEKTKEE